MVCSNCGKEIPNNSSYCIYCHAPTGYSEEINVNMDILEDDELIGALNKPARKKVQEVEIKTDEKGGTSKKTVIISLVSFICCVGLVIVSYSYLNSYGYIIKKANKAMQNGEYDNAYQLYERALVKNQESVEALIGAGEASKQSGNFDESEKLFTKALEVDNQNDTAFTSLIELYNITESPEKIVEAEKFVSTEKMKEVFTEAVVEVIVETPEFSLAGGEFNDEILLTLTSKSGLQIYYTTDGKDPSKGDGSLFEGEIKLSKEGTTTVKACCIKDGRASTVKEETYTIKYPTPSIPEVSPMTGSFTEETKITIKTNVEGAKIYYTWDGKDPSELSKQYKEPLVVPEGNNVLSIVVVSKNGKYSEILRCSYTYLPSQESEPDGSEGTETSEQPEIIESTEGGEMTAEPDADYPESEEIVAEEQIDNE